MYGEELRGRRGLWKDFFSTEPQRLFLEIGCHKGLTLRALGQDHPGDGFLGLDRTFKRVVLTAQRSKELPNVGTIYGDGRFFGELFCPGELDGVVLFFPDPWNKKISQKHNRLVNLEFVQTLRSVLKPGIGFFWFKTDDQNYFEETSVFLDQCGFVKSPSILPFGRDYCSTFENRFLRQKVPYFTGVWSVVS
jgi:tRNA (guanine-N7-)-methyltransferase